MIIRDNDFDHRMAFEDDDGIRFKPKDGTNPEYLATLYRSLDKVAPHQYEPEDDDDLDEALV